MMEASRPFFLAVTLHPDAPTGKSLTKANLWLLKMAPHF